ncbi:MAG: family tricarboxylate transporter, receptor protein [Tardiphaga sp.]|nr:family tricarboxylate transporter, receptor protein [Tardiphaga sp.]
MLRSTHILLSLLALWTAATPVQAETFPSRQVTIVSPYQAGGTSDIIARLIAKKLADVWKQPVIVENKAGANGGIGVMAVVKAPPDGYTLLATASSALTINPLIYPNIAYDVARDLAPITRTGFVPNVLVVNPSLPARTVAELIALAKSKPGSLNYASQGNGSNGHLTGEMFRQQSSIDIVHIPYKGSAPAVTDLVGGQVQLMFDNLPSVLEQIRGGQLRALAVTTAARTATLPDVPTLDQSGLPGFDSSAWFAILVAGSTPEPMRAEIERAVVGIMKDDEITRKLAELGITAVAGGSGELAQRIGAESRAWRDVIVKAGIKVE